MFAGSHKKGKLTPDQVSSFQSRGCSRKFIGKMIGWLISECVTEVIFHVPPAVNRQAGSVQTSA